ncbi:hypothetical protein KR018_012417, partial [Drosophila ironensis]
REGQAEEGATPNPRAAWRVFGCWRYGCHPSPYGARTPTGRPHGQAIGRSGHPVGQGDRLDDGAGPGNGRD